jgi:hypothetical protein
MENLLCTRTKIWISAEDNTKTSLDLALAVAPSASRLEIPEFSNLNFKPILHDCARPNRRRWPARPDLGERWPSRLVATAARLARSTATVNSLKD